jgi:hypothetical protein
VKHAFATSGIRTATLTVTDASGRTDTATVSVLVLDVAPVFLGASITNRVFAVVPKARGAARRKPPRGTTFRYTLSEAATVRIVIQRRRKGGRFVRRGTLKAPGKAGANKKRFGGRIRGKALRRGRYRAVLRATDATGHKAKAKRLSFRIVRRR